MNDRDGCGKSRPHRDWIPDLVCNNNNNNNNNMQGTGVQLDK